jgi:hypothetical protein
MKPTALALMILGLLLLSGCAPAVPQPASIPVSTLTSPPPTVPPTETAIPTDTPVPATPTPVPQAVLLRRSCGRDYAVRADEPIQLFYGGWGVIGKQLAAEWATALTVELTIDGQIVPGEAQPPAPDLPHNCPKDSEGSYWLYSTAIIPGLSSGRHDVTVAFKALRALPDGAGGTYGVGEIGKQTFRVTAQ